MKASHAGGFAGRSIFFLVLFLSCRLAQGQTIVRVSPDGTGNGSSWAQASSLSAAVMNASEGAELWLKKGVYPITQTLALSEYAQTGMSLYGGFNGNETNRGQRNHENNTTALDGLGKRRILNIEVGDITIDGVTFRNGFIADKNDGGGAIFIYDSGTTLKNCIFRNNISEGSRGAGAIYNRSGSGLVIASCLFENNKTQNYVGDANGGGAIHNWADEVTITNTTFRNNSSHNDGGALYSWYNDDLTIENCVFQGNHSASWGGALHLRSNPTISNTKFIGNSCSEGGGAIYNGELLSMNKVSFLNNSAGDAGGAVYSNYGATNDIVNALFAGNQSNNEGGALFSSGGTDGGFGIANATFVSNKNSAIALQSYGGDYLHIYNSIFYDNTSSDGTSPDIRLRLSSTTPSTIEIKKNILQAAVDPKYGSGNQVGVDPMFVDMSGGVYTLQTSSPAIDAGQNALFNKVSTTKAAASTDLEGNDRVQGPSIDLGPYELDPSTITIPDCAVITAPADGAEDVAVDASISWKTVADASGYRVYIGTTAGGSEVVDGEQVTGTSFNLPADFEENTTYYVRVIPYNAAGRASGCDEISFTTETLLSRPDCADITAPADGAEDVPVDASISWSTIANASGYRVYIGTTAGGSDVVNGEEVTGTVYELPGGFEENTTYYARVIPYNAAGRAAGCAEISFTTEALLIRPDCAVITAPADGAEDVAVGAGISWNAVPDASGYRVYIGTTAGGGEVVDGEQVTGTNFNPPADLEENTTYYVRVIPYNGAGRARGCTEISFTTETLLARPNCAIITAPADEATDIALNTGISWNAVPDASGYRVFIGTTAGGSEVVDGEQVTGTNFNPPADLEENTTYYVRVIPYNGAGRARGCTEISFTTETLLARPDCAVITSPTDRADQVQLDALISWNAVPDASGYRVFIGTTAGGTDVVNDQEVTGTAYELPGGFEENTTYYVQVIPFNDAGTASGCAETSFTTETLLIRPDCAVIAAPADGAEDVAVDAGINWNAVADASGYRVYIGTTAGGSEVVDGEQVIGTNFNPPINLEENTTYYVRVIPYNAAGRARGCTEISFTTETLLARPDCVVITSPTDGADQVQLDARISWNAVPDASGYRIYIGTTAGGSEVVDGEQVTGTSFNPPINLEENTTYYVRVIPYNAAGRATGCTEVSFETGSLQTAPDCAVITSPTDGADQVQLDALITWNAVPNVSGYRVFIGTTSGGTDVVNGQEVTGTVYELPGGFEENTTYYVRVISFNDAGTASGCAETSFTTETLLIRPDCAIITAPADGAEDVAVDAGISWNTVPDASGYRVYIGTTVGGSEVVAGEQVTGTSFNPPADLEENTTYYVRVIPYNAAGRARGCTEISFETGSSQTAPDCAVITSPTDGADQVQLDARISWNAVPDASGYRVFIGTTAGGTDVVNGQEVSGTAYELPGGFEENTTYYVRVISFNDAGTASGCTETSFTTETLLTRPDCAIITAPADKATDIALNTGISWNAVPDASGYRVFIGTTAGGSEVVAGEQVTGTNFNPSADLEENTTYYVRVIPYNGAGRARGCTEISFETGSLQTAPDCAVITSPLDGSDQVQLDALITWNAVPDASGYRVFIGTTAGGIDVVNGQEVSGTAYELQDGFEENTSYYVRIIPFNDAGTASACAETSFTTETLLTRPDCTVIAAPADGAEGVAVDAGISWNAVADASGYRVYIGTTAGGSEVVDGEQVTGTSFNPPADLEENTTYYVRVIPYNAAGRASGCTEISFTTETLLARPDCAIITAPADEATDIALNTGISWNAVPDASGYRVFIGTTAGGTDVVNGQEVSGTAYELPGNFEENTTYYVRVIPYNGAGRARGCTEISFTTETLLTRPDCAVITSPTDGADQVQLDALITWNAVPDASGYRVFIGTTTGGSEVVDGEQVTGTNFNPPVDLEENTTYYVRVIPYNAAGRASGCDEISFTTETLLTRPDCADITAPAGGAEDVAVDASISWNAVPDASGYRVFIGTTAGGSEVVDGEQVIGTNFNPPINLEENTTYYVRVIPYNAAGRATGCTEVSFETGSLQTAPDCAVITSPTDGADQVQLDALITWNAVPNVSGYRVFIGTTSGGTDVVNGQEVTGTVYELPGGFEENTTYYVRVISFNDAGTASGCAKTSFTTETLLIRPDCAIITAPADGAEDVAVDAGISWNTVADASGYRVYIGTTAGGSEVVDGEQVTGTNFNPPINLEENTTYYVRVIPYNAAGRATGCTEVSFETGSLQTAPDCAVITSPTDGADQVQLDALITWNAVPNASGYRVFIGTTSGGTDVVNGQEVTGTVYELPGGFEENITYYARVISFNDAGTASACTETSFTTETLLTSPDCAIITAPADKATDIALNTGISWNAVPDASGYRVYIGTTAGGSEVVDGEQVTGTNFNPPADLEENKTYYVRVIPYNGAGRATGCTEISFTTETRLTTPDCAVITSPKDGADQVQLDALITWNAIPDASGYRVFIGTTAGGTDVVNGQEVSRTSYELPGGLEENTTYYVRVISFNDAGTASACTEISFTTETGKHISRTKYGVSPNGDGINDVWTIEGIERYPENTVFIYNRWGDLVFQIRNYDNQSKLFTGQANRLTRLGAGALPSATYFFKIQYRNEDGINKVEGFLVLRR